MAYGDIGAVIDTLEFDTVQGMDCWGIHVSGDVYAVAYQGPASNLYVTTFSIDAAGAISNTVLATIALSPSWGVLPHVVKVADNVFAIVYQGTNFHLTVETVSVSDDGLTLSSIEELVIVSLDCRAPKIVRVAGDVFAVSYLETAVSDVKVSTITINAAGDVSAIIDTIVITSTGTYYTNIVPVDTTIFAVQCLDTTNGVLVATIEISDAGAITDTVIDTQVITGNVSNFSHGMTEVLSGVFAIAYIGTDLDGFVSTVTIDGAGEISTVVDTLEIYTADTRELCIIHVGGGICAVTYKKEALLDGCVGTVDIDASGNIGAALIDSLDFETEHYRDGMILPISGNIYAIFYGGGASDGFVKTLDISTALPAGPHHEMLLGMGP